MNDQSYRDYRRAAEIVSMLNEADAALPAVGRLLPELLGEGEPDSPDQWRCVRCGGELALGERYACLQCMGNDDSGQPWIGARPKRRPE